MMDNLEFKKAVEEAQGDVEKLEVVVYEYLSTDPAWKEIG